MRISFSPSSKIICGSLLSGIALASLLNLANHPVHRVGVSDIQAKKSGFIDAQDEDEYFVTLRRVFGESFKELTKGKPKGLSPYQYAEAEKILRTGSEGAKSDMVFTVAHLGYHYGKVGPKGYLPGKMPPEALRLLTQQASSPSADNRKSLAYAIAWCKDPPVRTLFTRLGNDPDPKVSGYVTNYLREEAEDSRQAALEQAQGKAK